MGLKNLFKKKNDDLVDDKSVTEEKAEETVESKAVESVKEETKDEEVKPVKIQVESEQEEGAPSMKGIAISKERRNEIGPIIFKKDMQESDLEPLTIQETIFLLCSVDHFNESSKVENYEQKCELLDKMLAKKLKEADVLYLLFDKMTKYPFIMQGCVEMYSEKDFAEEAIKHYKGQYRVLEAREIKKEDKSFPGDMGVFEYLYYLGMEHILIDNGKFKTVVERQDVLPMEQNLTNSDLSKPILNPKLRYAIIDFFEEARWPVNYEKRDETMKTKEEKMLAELKQAKLLIPMRFQGEEVQKSGNQVTIKKGTNMMLPKIETKDHAAFTPLFTDWVEFAKVYNKNQWNGLIMTFKDAIALSKEMGLVINPTGENLIMNQQSFEALKQKEEIAAKEEEK